MAALYSRPSTPLEQAHLGAYWQVQMRSVLERLEREARRMLQLEAELSHFSQEYYEAVGKAAERLARMEVELSSAAAPPHDIVQTMPTVIASRDAREARRVELKMRYRTLAKEIHPDRAMIVENSGSNADAMQALNAAYQQGDLAAVLRIEAQMLLAELLEDPASSPNTREAALRDLEKAANTYAEAYRALLNSPLNELMLRAMSARLAGWDWMDAVVKKVERAIEHKERALIEAGIAQIGAWRESVGNAA